MKLKWGIRCALTRIVEIPICTQSLAEPMTLNNDVSLGSTRQTPYYETIMDVSIVETWISNNDSLLYGVAAIYILHLTKNSQLYPHTIQFLLIM